MKLLGTMGLIKIPSKPTLKKYGLDLPSWKAIAERQGYICGACGKAPSTGVLCIDHEHVKGWKKMPDKQRARHVRGLLCYMCNRFYCARGMTINKAMGVVAYLTLYEKRKATHGIGR